MLLSLPSTCKRLKRLFNEKTCVQRFVWIFWVSWIKWWERSHSSLAQVANVQKQFRESTPVAYDFWKLIDSGRLAEDITRSGSFLGNSFGILALSIEFGTFLRQGSSRCPWRWGARVWEQRWKLTRWVRWVRWVTERKQCNDALTGIDF